MQMPAIVPGTPTAMAVEAYAQAGHTVIPLCRAVPDGGCTCHWHAAHGVHQDPAHNKIGKVPVIGKLHNLQAIAEHGTTIEEIRRMPWSYGPNIGLCLQPSRLAVVDLDGRDGFAEAKSLGLPQTAWVRRGAHRIHLYYMLPDGVTPVRATHRGNSGQIDVLGRGYVVAPPSVHSSGDTYTWRDTDQELAALPEWAANMLQQAHAATPTAALQHPTLPQSTGTSWVDTILEDLRRMAEGQSAVRTSTTANMTPDDILAAMREHAVPQWCVQRVMTGSVPSGSDRDARDWAVTRCLVEHHVPAEVITAAYRQLPIGDKYHSRSDPDAYLQGMLAKHAADGVGRLAVQYRNTSELGG